MFRRLVRAAPVALASNAFRRHPENAPVDALHESRGAALIVRVVLIDSVAHRLRRVVVISHRVRVRRARAPVVADDYDAYGGEPLTNDYGVVSEDF